MVSYRADDLVKLVKIPTGGQKSSCISTTSKAVLPFLVSSGAAILTRRFGVSGFAMWVGSQVWTNNRWLIITIVKAFSATAPAAIDKYSRLQVPSKY